MSEDLIEAVARALADDSSKDGTWMDAARAALAAIEASGTHVVVPVEPTREMLNTGAVVNWGADTEVTMIAARTWPAMLSARPRFTGEGT